MLATMPVAIAVATVANLVAALVATMPMAIGGDTLSLDLVVGAGGRVPVIVFCAARSGQFLKK